MNESESFFVSVIIPVYNGENFIVGAIENVINQQYQPLEIIVVDDGSTDQTANIVSQFKAQVKYVYQNNSGPASARNKGIKLSQGNIIAFLDTDDLWSENKLAIQLDYLAQNPNCSIVQGLIQQMELTRFSETELPFFEKVHQPYQYINIGSAIYRKSVFDQVGLFDEKMTYGEDVDWFFRAWENGISKAVLKEVNLFYRKHQQSMTVGKKLVEVGFIKIFKKHLDRCRQNGTLNYQIASGMPSISEYIGMPPQNYKV